MRGKKLACDKSEYENQAGKEFLAGKEPTTSTRNRRLVPSNQMSTNLNLVQ